MRKRSGVSAILVGSLLISSSTGLHADDRLKKDRRRMALGMVSVAASPVVMTAGVFSFNPVIAGTGMAMLGGGAGLMGVGGAGYISHKREERRAREGSANDQPAQFEALVAVPGQPGYYYYPSNPNQLYVDPSQVADPVPAMIAAPQPATPDLIMLRIANKAKDGRSIDCAVNGLRFSVPPGYTQTLTAAPGAVISFETGNNEGAIEHYTLAEGSYEFRSDENIWRFYTQLPARSVASGSPVTNPTTGASVPR